jgi:hypothetical protein
MDNRYRKMDNRFDGRFDIEDEQYDFNSMKAKTSKKRKHKNRKETGITKKDRLILKKWREKIVELKFP